MIWPMQAFDAWLEETKVFMYYKPYNEAIKSGFYIVDVVPYPDAPIEKSYSVGLCKLANKSFSAKLKKVTGYRELDDWYDIKDLYLNK